MAINHSANPTEEASFALGFAAGGRCMGNDSVGQSGERQALQPDSAMAGQGGEEESFPAKEHAFKPFYHL